MRGLGVVLAIALCVSIHLVNAFQLKSSSSLSGIKGNRITSLRRLQAVATDPRAATDGKKLWTPYSWKDYPVKQPPNYPDQVRHSEFFRLNSSILISGNSLCHVICA